MPVLPAWSFIDWDRAERLVEVTVALMLTATELVPCRVKPTVPVVFRLEMVAVVVASAVTPVFADWALTRPAMALAALWTPTSTVAEPSGPTMVRVWAATLFPPVVSATPIPTRPSEPAATPREASVETAETILSALAKVNVAVARCE